MENEVKTNPDEPIKTIEYNNNYISNGLTKREYFAAMALQGLLANNNNYVYSVISAVEFADDLIKELNKTNNNGKIL
jgi:cyanate lyase